MSCNYDADFALALQLQNEINNEEENASNKIRNNLFNTNQTGNTHEVSSGHAVVDDSLELFDPTPDIYALFREFDRIYFEGKLSCCEVKWSPRMTLCAGLCCYEGHGGLCSIRLSTPLLRLRPRKDLVQTLLHEMIHAYLFVTHNNKDHDAHGPEFLKHMHHINKLSGANITVYHTFHDEVDAYRKHWWQCNGPCKTRKPFYGLLKRAMNRTPGPSDTWWSEHQRTCNGIFIKIKSPEAPSNGAKRKSNEPTGIGSTNKKLFTGQGNILGSLDKNIKSDSHHSTSIEKFLNKVQNKDWMPSISSTQEHRSSAFIKEMDLICSPSKQLATSSPDKSKRQTSIDNYFTVNSQAPSSISQDRNKLEKDTIKQSATTNISTMAGKELYNWIFSDESDDEPSKPNISLTGNNSLTVIDNHNAMQVLCPACNSKISEAKINEHLDQCLS